MWIPFLCDLLHRHNCEFPSNCLHHFIQRVTTLLSCGVSKGTSAHLLSQLSCDTTTICSYLVLLSSVSLSLYAQGSVQPLVHMRPVSAGALQAVWVKRCRRVSRNLRFKSQKHCKANHRFAARPSFQWKMVTYHLLDGHNILTPTQLTSAAT